jgi:MFS family permease
VAVGISPVLTGPFLRAALTNFFFFASLNCFYLLPLYIRRLGGTEVEIGLIMGMYNASAIFCQPFVGVWVDQLGRRPFMLLGAGLVALSAVVFSVSASAVVFAFLRILQGVGYSAFFVANYTLIVDLVPVDRRGWALGIFGISGLLSTALAPLASEWVIRGFGFPAFFVLAIVLALVAVVLAWRTRDAYGMILAPSVGRAAVQEGLGELFRLPMALAFTFGLGLGTIFTFLPTFAELLGVRNLALFYTGYAGSAMLVRAVGGELIDTLGRRAVIVPSLFLQSAGGVLLALLAVLVDAHTPLPVLPFLLLAGFLAGGAHGFLYPALSALLMDQTPEARRGSAVGIFSSVILTGNAAGAMVFGYVAHGLGYGVMWSSLAILLALGFGASLRLRPSP